MSILNLIISRRSIFNGSNTFCDEGKKKQRRKIKFLFQKFLFHFAEIKFRSKERKLNISRFPSGESKNLDFEHVGPVVSEPSAHLHQLELQTVGETETYMRTLFFIMILPNKTSSVETNCILSSSGLIQFCRVSNKFL